MSGARAKRGIDPATLLGLVENTAPFIFAPEFPGLPYIETLRAYKAAPPPHLNHLEYFRLCLSSHFATVATFVPTDVDNQIRKHLWDESVALATTEKMAELLLESRGWDFRSVTARYSEAEGAMVSGHQGEWFSVAVGAYASHKRRKPDLAQAISEEIVKELHQEARIFSAFKKEKNGIELLRASYSIAHNLGDLDRVIDQWELPPDDALRVRVYKLGHEKHATFGSEQEALLEAGQLNKSLAASENHRHYPLRKPKCLRVARDLLLPIGPFFDAWGAHVARHPALTRENLGEIGEALLDGFERLSSPKIPLYGYARALKGLQENFPGGSRLFAEYLPARVAKALGKGVLAEIQRPAAEVFNAQWSKKALNFLKLA